MIGDLLDFFVPGLAVPGGSKRAFPVPGRDGHTRINVVDSSGPKGREWRAAIRLAAATACTRASAGRTPWQGAVGLELWFYVPRPRAQLGRDGLRPRAPTWPTTRPDVLKLARAVEDSLTGILWVDDAQIADEHLRKLYADGGLKLGVRIRATVLAERHPAPAPKRDAAPRLPGLEAD